MNQATNGSGAKCFNPARTRGMHVLALLLVLAVLPNPRPAAAQLPLPAEDSVIEEPTSEIAVNPAARDAQISGRLQRILTASGWFTPARVSVREGIVFLDGQTETTERRAWAEQLAGRTEDVVAVVNRIVVERPVSWNLAPTWREVQRLADQAKWLAPLALASLAIIALFWFAARGVAQITRRTLRRRLTSALLADLAARAIAFPVILLGIYLVLQVAGLTRLAVTVLGGTGLIGIVIGLAFRDIAENMLASVLLSVRNPFRTGDWIRIGEHQGLVQNLNLRTTILLTLDGNHVQIPNSIVFKSIITNFSSNPNRRADFGVGIGYPDSIVAAQDVIMAALRAHPAVLADPEPAVIVDELGASTVNLSVQFWFDGRAYSIFRVRSSLMRQVKRALQAAGVSMPDAAREIIFPEGVPFRRMAGDEQLPGGPALSDTAAQHDDAVTMSGGEGNLTSEQGPLARQAQAAVLPEAGENLLAPVR
ncbi:mechanosensitive ion channel domain-containing protein [Sandarakinorhabdus sp.]|uniref:mechanosensitive ion channel domain-containing protein n=1 Tax=Sandarakinorhabdus sp. TaxID=1916663 RepID=UPI003F6FAB65